MVKLFKYDRAYIVGFLLTILFIVYSITAYIHYNNDVYNDLYIVKGRSIPVKVDKNDIKYQYKGEGKSLIHWIRRLKQEDEFMSIAAWYFPEKSSTLNYDDNKVSIIFRSISNGDIYTAPVSSSRLFSREDIYTHFINEGFRFNGNKFGIGLSVNMSYLPADKYQIGFYYENAEDFGTIYTDETVLVKPSGKDVIWSHNVPGITSLPRDISIGEELYAPILAVDGVNYLDGKPYLQVLGFAVNGSVNPQDEDKFVRILFENGRHIDIPATIMVWRPLIKERNDDTYQYAGFRALLPMSQVFFGEIQIRVIVKNKKTGKLIISSGVEYNIKMQSDKR